VLPRRFLGLASMFLHRLRQVHVFQSAYLTAFDIYGLHTSSTVVSKDTALLLTHGRPQACRLAVYIRPPIGCVLMSDMA